MNNSVRATIMCGVLVAAMGACAATARAQNYTSPYFNIAIAAATPPGIVVRRTVRSNVQDQRAMQAQIVRGKQTIRDGKATTIFHHTGDVVLDPSFANYVHLYEAEARKENLPLNDLAVTISCFIDVGLQLYRGIPELNAKQFDSVVARVRGELLNDPKVQGLDDRGKQSLHEAWASILVELSTGVIEARKEDNPVALRQARARVGKKLQALLEASPDAVKVTETSVVLP